MQAIILAAGMGRRLKELTSDKAKCMVSVNGETLIERMLNQLDKKGLSKIFLVVGYEAEKLIEYVKSLKISTPIEFVNNTQFAKTNNIYSLALAKEELCKEDSLILESDLIFEESLLDDLISDQRDTLVLVAKFEHWMDGTCLKLSDDDSITEFISKRNFRFNDAENYYKTVNIHKFSKSFSQNYYVPFLEAYTKALGNNEYYEQVLKVIAMLDDPVIKAKRIDKKLWYEIDDIEDLNSASLLFSMDDESRYKALSERFGGYWRNTGLLDFCYLVNPFYPRGKMMDEIKYSFSKLLTQYPSGEKEIALLAGKYFAVPKEYIAVGNGAAELIKTIMDNISGKVGFIRPTFEEYINRYNREGAVYFYPQNEAFTYTAEDIISFFDDKEINSLFLVNPDNPSGNYIDKNNMEKLIFWAKEKAINLFVDESFIDFATEKCEYIDKSLLDDNRHLFIIKSISKSHGVPGLRLGVLASADVDYISKIKATLPIWNINSFAEYYLQIVQKYENDYKNARADFLEERNRFFALLQKVSGIKIFPSEANFFLVKTKAEAGVVAKALLSKYGIFIKDLTNKTGNKNYIRIAVRSAKDNDTFINALREVLGE